MKHLSALFVLVAACAPTVSFADVTFRQVIEFKVNMGLPIGAPQGGFPFSGPTEIVARVKGTRSYTSFGSIASISNSANNQIILLDTSGKRYAITSMAEYLDQITKTINSSQVPQSALQILNNIQIKVDTRETGKSENISGISADETEIQFTMTIPLPMPMPGTNANGMELSGHFQVWKPNPAENERVPALREISIYYEQSRKTGLDATAMMTKLFGTLPGMGDKMAELVSAMQKGGSVTLKLHGEFIMPGLAAMVAQARAGGANVPSIPEGPLLEFDSSLKDLNADSIPDSAFQIPEGYQEAPVADVIKAFLPGASK